jgi:hypothetical protein
LYAVDLSGTWDFNVEAPAAGNGKPTVQIRQDGENLVGVYKGRIGSQKLEGRLIKKEFFFIVTTVRGDIRFTGTVDSTGKRVEGIVEVAGLSSGKFSGKKK